MTWPIVEGTSLMHLHISRGKRSIVVDLRTDEGRDVFLDLVAGADAVIEAMRPGGLDKRGVGYDACRAVNPRIVFCTISGYGMTGPYKDMPSHGIAYDVWAGLVAPETSDEGYCAIPEHPSVGIHAGPLFGALGVLAGITRARATGEPCRLEVAQSDAAAAMDWLRSETWKAYERPESEVTGNEADAYERRAPGTAGMRDGVRYQFYETADGHVLFMASEREFWQSFCQAVDRADLFEQHPGSQYADHARGNTELRAELATIFRSRTTAAWVSLGDAANTPIAPVNTPQTLADDPQFQARLPWIPRSRMGTDQVPSPIKVLDEEHPPPTRAPTAGQHTDEVLREVLGLDDQRIAALRRAGAVA
jgi:crotonobetainyl-CoA:carnitine CoA-transferase CaiB-like acyl-CoA transferase